MPQHCTTILLVIAAIAFPLQASESAAQLPDPDGTPADMAKPVQVFIIMGQSNTLEMGHVSGGKGGSLEEAVKQEGLYPFMIDESGNWTTRMDVRNVHVMGSGGPGKAKVKRNDWLTVSGKKIGIEIGIGHQLGHALNEPVLILKSAIGNRSLGWDLLPPGSQRYEFTDPKDGKTYTYAAHGESPDRWESGTTGEPVKWTAGIQYIGDVARATDVLKQLDQYYPGARGFEIAGFFYWQGDKDRYDAGHASRYEHNLVNLIAALRRDFQAPDAPFVCATLGQTSKESGTGNDRLILDAQLAISDPERQPELAGSVATVYTNPLSMGSSSNAHYGGNAKTYMNVGLAMGEAMVQLLAAK